MARGKVFLLIEVSAKDSDVVMQVVEFVVTEVTKLVRRLKNKDAASMALYDSAGELVEALLMGPDFDPPARKIPVLWDQPKPQ